MVDEAPFKLIPISGMLNPTNPDSNNNNPPQYLQNGPLFIDLVAAVNKAREFAELETTDLADPIRVIIPGKLDCAKKWTAEMEVRLIHESCSIKPLPTRRYGQTENSIQENLFDLNKACKDRTIGSVFKSDTDPVLCSPLHLANFLNYTTPAPLIPVQYPQISPGYYAQNFYNNPPIPTANIHPDPYCTGQSSPYYVPGDQWINMRPIVYDTRIIPYSYPHPR